MLGIDGQCLLTQNWLVVFNCLSAILIVMAVWRTDVNDVDIWILDEFLIRAVGGALCVPLLAFDEVGDKLCG